MNKYRIVQIDEFNKMGELSRSYNVQFRYLLVFWITFKSGIAQSNITFYSLEEVRKYIDGAIASDKKTVTIIPYTC